MGREGLLIGEVAAQSGASRKALRLYEAAGILPAPRRTPSGYRVYERQTLSLLGFVHRAQRLGFTLEEIKEIVAIRQAGHRPCAHVRELVRQKAEQLDQTLADLTQLRQGLRALLENWRSARRRGAVVCPHIERVSQSDQGRTRWKA